MIEYRVEVAVSRANGTTDKRSKWPKVVVQAYNEAIFSRVALSSIARFCVKTYLLFIDDRSIFGKNTNLANFIGLRNFINSIES